MNEKSVEPTNPESINEDTYVFPDEAGLCQPGLACPDLSNFISSSLDFTDYSLANMPVASNKSDNSGAETTRSHQIGESK
jgi:hypothetical protein